MFYSILWLFLLFLLLLLLLLFKTTKILFKVQAETWLNFIVIIYIMKFPLKSLAWEFLTLKACELLLEKVSFISKISD